MQCFAIVCTWPAPRFIAILFLQMTTARKVSMAGFETCLQLAYANVLHSASCLTCVCCLAVLRVKTCHVTDPWTLSFAKLSAVSAPICVFSY